jgi:glyoxylase I family protein
MSGKNGVRLLASLGNWQGGYRLTDLRGPSGVLVMLAQDMTKSWG